jgi:hypothetical protein
MGDDIPDFGNPSLKLAPVVEVQQAQVREHDHIRPPESHENLEHLWEDESDLSITIQRAKYLRYAARNGFADAAGGPILFKMKMWYRILIALQRDTTIPYNHYIKICAYLDEMRSIFT